MRQFVDSFLDFAPRLISPFVHVLAVIVIGSLVLKLIDTTLKRIAMIVPADDGHRARLDHRAMTLRQIVRSFGKAVVGALIVVVVAVEFNFYEYLGALVAGAGILGLAIGFGAQSLVKDVISGFFVLLEDQYGVGETVRIGTLEGVVEGMTLRLTILRNADGEVHVIPNGSIQTVTVLSRDWRRALVDVEVAASEELGRAFGVLARVNDALAKDMSGSVVDKPSILGIEKLSGNGVTVRLAARTLPGKEANVAHEWRRRIKDTFDQEGIRLAERFQLR